MMSPRDAVTAITSSRLIGIVREHTTDAAKQEVDRLVAAGVRAIEVSLSTPGALDVARWMAHQFSDDGVQFGVGTVLTDQDVRDAAAAGAAFVVSPISTAGLISTCRELRLASVVGALTPTECVNATLAGADLVKLFPAKLWTLDTLKALLQALPLLKLVPTGGMRMSDARPWLDAGAVAVGMGGGLRSAGSAADLRAAIASLAA
ncbi:bifunctional 4-hydroxy-2-oxoglutarate aldolase/2-dehydro-3-deoxy-phosphogluconate aldolase [Parafrigoribacterium mesophilum]|uniref:bifunctional 4-hydroxy-2-oxoglutarate aldolase/2-dehydro-3-deoxy-phosphogluconate aldolase n=1 Tax=Parafrigoribacterium mesophilum TaxID=433646 RepID=UPI0031FDFC32